MMTKLAIATAALVFTFAVPTLANEDSIKLKPGEGAEVVEQNCATCHSLDYIEMNSVFLDQKGWQAEVTKMVKAFDAPVTEQDQAKIIAYLVAIYGKQ
jgi:mono/diheme cytochrome c family protein